MLFLAAVISLVYLLIIKLTFWDLLLLHSVVASVFLLCLRVLRYWNVMAVVEAVWCIMGLLVCGSVIYVVLALLKSILVGNDLWLAWHSFWIWVFAVGADVHVAVIFLLEWWPSFLTDEAIGLFAFVALLEKRLRRRWLGLTMVVADVAADVFALVEVSVCIAYLFHYFFCCWTHCNSVSLIVAQDVSICHILCVNAASTLDHR